MRKILKIIGVIALLGIIGVGLFLWSLHEARPSGITGEKADELARRMMAGVGKTAWDSTKIIAWTFRGEHNFVWDKERHLVRVNWAENTVYLNPNEISGKVFESKQEIKGDEKYELIQTAWSYFCNDAFWVIAPLKVFDPGTKRSIVTQEDGSESLLVEYSSGGVTPGDAYLWHLDKDGKPKSWQMWVSIIPVGGLTFSWADWSTLSTGAKYAQNHKSGPLNIDITNVKIGESFSELGVDEKMFDGL